MNAVDIYRGGDLLVTLDIDEKTIFTKKLQGEHKITSEYIHSGPSGLDLTIGDYLYYPASGESASASYAINRLPTVTKINNSTFRYNIDFEANQYNLNKKLLISSDKLADFSYNGAPADFLSLILSNINEINPGWIAESGVNLMTDPDGQGHTYDTLTVAGITIASGINLAGTAFCESNIINFVSGDIITITLTLTSNSGELPLVTLVKIGTGAVSDSQSLAAGLNIIKLTASGTGDAIEFKNTDAANWWTSDIIVNREGIDTIGEDKTLQFVNDSCMSALNKVAEAYSFEYDINGQIIDLRSSIIGASGYTFRYGEASGLYKLERQQVLNQNIITRCYGFGAEKNIPSGYRAPAGGNKRLIFSASGMSASGYIDAVAAQALYGVIEGVYTNDDIYPNRTGTISSVNFAASGIGAWDANTDYIVDSSMNFDINDYLIEGQTAKIVFKSGDLSGVECEIWQYTNAAKKFYITPFIDTDGTIRPNSVNYPASGDTYTLVNIAMPQSYVDTAETDLRVATQAHLDKYSVPQVVYNIDIDPHYASGMGISLNVGDKVTIEDTDLGINSLIRISGIEYPLVNPYKIKATIADFVPYSMQQQIIKSTISNSQKTTTVDRTKTEQVRVNKVDHNVLKETVDLKAPMADPSLTGATSVENLDIGAGLTLYNYSQQDTPAELPYPLPYSYIALDNPAESTLYLPPSGLPGDGSAQLLIVNHLLGTELGAGKYHIHGHGNNIINAGVAATGYNLDEGHCIVLAWDPRQGGNWYVVSS